MFDEIRKMFKGEGATWHLVGYDTNANTSYPIAGPFFSQIATERAAPGSRSIAATASIPVISSSPKAAPNRANLVFRLCKVH